MKKIQYILTVTLCFLCIKIYAQEAPKYSNEFLNIGIGSRGLAKGGAHIAYVDDAQSAYWNSAGLSRIDADVQLFLKHSEHFGGIASLDFGSLALNINEQSNIAFSVVRFGIDDIPNTFNLIDGSGAIRYDRVTAFSSVDYAFNLAYARKLKIENLSIGANLKIIRRIAGSFANAWGFGIDIGSQYNTGNWYFGVNARDITTTYNIWSFYWTEEQKDVLAATGNEIPLSSTELTLPRVVFGVARYFELSGKFELIPEFNFVTSYYGRENTLISSNFINIDPSLGVELAYDELIYFRCGVNNLQFHKPNIPGVEKDVFAIQPSIGLGLKFKQLELDYAMINLGRFVEMYPVSHVISLQFSVHK